MKVLTIKGLVERDQLTVKDVVQEEGNSGLRDGMVFRQRVSR